MRIDTSKDIHSESPRTLQILLLFLAAALVTGLGIITMVDPEWLF